MKQFAMAIAGFCIALTVTAQKKPVINASLQKAIVFLQGTELEHTAKVTIPAGNSEIVIGNLADVIDENSIQVGSDADINILSASTAKDFVDEKAPATGVEAIQRLIDSATLEKTRIENRKKAEETVLEFLEANRSIGGTSTGVKLEDLMRTAEYVKNKTLEVKNNLIALDQKLAKQTELIARLEYQLEEQSGVGKKEKGRIVLQVNSSSTVSTTLTITYLCANAWWKPAYDIKVGSSTSKVNLRYKAEIHQSTGLDWSKIKLSLASSMPSQFGAAPLLNAWYLQYYTPTVTGYKDVNFLGSANSLTMNMYNAPALDNRRFSLGNSLSFLKSADSMKLFKEALSDYVTVNENPIFVSFDIDLPYDLPSDGKAYTVNMKEYDLPANLKHYAVPKLDKDVYLLAQITDWEKLSLLPGDASIILNGTYVGKTNISLATSDTLSITVGRDKRVVVKREKLVDYSSTRFIGSNKTQKFTYEITLKNSNNDKVKMHLKDQVPLSNDKNIEIELGDNENAVLNEDLGVLNWMIELQPKEVRKIRFTYTVKYPKDKQIRNF
jgi:uncharacterized protein (TIGR02231 family)